MQGKLPSKSLCSVLSSHRKVLLDSKSSSNLPAVPPKTVPAQDIALAWSYLKDDHNVLFQGSLYAHLYDLCINSAEDLQQTSDNLLVAISATLKPAPNKKKKFLDAMHKSGGTVKI
jgi:hypothetical protein